MSENGDRSPIISCQTIYNTLLVPLGAIGLQQVAEQKTKETIKMLLGHFATYSKYGITYRASDIVLCAYVDSRSNNKTKPRCRTGARTFLFEEKSYLWRNGLVLALA